jgi:molecular chaperone GrpE
MNESPKDENKKSEISPELMEQIQFLSSKFEEKMKENEEKIIHLQKENMANLANQKKQHEKETENMKKYMFQKFLEDILIVLDSLEIGLKAKPDTYEKFLNGLQMTHGIFLNILKKYQTELIDTKIGDVFDDHIHECIGTEENADNNRVAVILSTGYKLNDRVIRPTKVLVGTKQFND